MHFCTAKPAACDNCTRKASGTVHTSQALAVNLTSCSYMETAEMADLHLGIIVSKLSKSESQNVSIPGDTSLVTSMLQLSVL